MITLIDNITIQDLWHRGSEISVTYKKGEVISILSTWEGISNVYYGLSAKKVYNEILVEQLYDAFKGQI